MNIILFEEPYYPDNKWYQNDNQGNGFGDAHNYINVLENNHINDYINNVEDYINSYKNNYGDGYGYGNGDGDGFGNGY
jgi:hypothetical protein